MLEALPGLSTVWRADEMTRSKGAVVVATGSAVLDAQLPGGGWPVGAVVEILQAEKHPRGNPHGSPHDGLNGGHCEWRLLLPALVHVTLASSAAVVLVGAPHAPFAPGLAGQGLDPHRLLCINTATSASRLWATEQALRCKDVAAVLAWLPQARPDQLRRLQMAAAEHTKLLFVMRPAQARHESSPAVLRLLASTQSGSDALLLHILKRRGPPLDQPLLLPARPARLAALLAVCGDRAGEAGAAAVAGPAGVALQPLGAKHVHPRSVQSSAALQAGGRLWNLPSSPPSPPSPPAGEGRGEGREESACEASKGSFLSRRPDHALDRIAAAA